MTATDREIAVVAQRLAQRRAELVDLRAQIEDDEDELARLRNTQPATRSIEDHLLAIAPQEGFDIDEISDDDRRQIARVVLDAYLLGVAWLTRETDHGFKREDPLRVEVRDRRMT